MGILVLLIIIAILLIFWFISIYNKLIRQIEAVNNNEKQIDIQLDRRYKVFEELIGVVKKYMDYEKTTLKDVVALRNQAKQAQQSGDSQARMQAEDALSKIASGLNVVFENYPDLKANQNAMQLQEEIVNTENKLTYAKQAFNDSIENYNATKKSFIESMVVNMAAEKLDKTFIYWNVGDDKKRDELESYKADMS